MVDEACRQEGSPVSAGVLALPVECPASLLEEICEITLAESARQPHVAVEFNGPLFGKNLDINYRVPFRHRRLEVCGVLFGNREETHVQIRDFRRLVLEDDFEQSAALSERERQALAALIAGTKADPELPGIEPVGWLRADPRNRLTLSKRDLEIFQYFFNEPWQLALMLRPVRSGPAKARFILRKADGSICPASALRDEVVSPAAENPIVRVEREAPPHGVERAGPVVAAEAWRPPRPRMPAMSLSSFSWILGIVLALGYWWIKSSPQSSFHNPTKRSPAAAADGQKKVEQEAAALWKKWQEELQKNHQIDMPTETLQQQPSVKASTPDVPEETPPSESLKQEQPREERRQKPVRKPPERPRAVAAHPPQPVAPVLRTEKRYTPPRPAPPHTFETRALAQVRTMAPPPELRQTPPTQAPPEQTAPPAAAVLPAPPPAAAKNPAPPPPTISAAPASGRLIWTGHLQKNQTLTIDGPNASTGSITGELPGKPIQLKILPGDLADDGIVMYTANAQSASAVYESPGPQNGWNKTLYALNPRRATEILLVEPPGPQNGWKRLVLRSKSQKASVILLEWTLAR